MAATLSDLKTWYDYGDTGEYSHMIIKTDWFSMEDYPIYVPHQENPRRYNIANEDNTMECYSYALGWEVQSKQHRANNWD